MEVITNLKEWFTDRIFSKSVDDYVILEIAPTTSVRNNKAYVLAQLIASFYRRPKERFNWVQDGRLLTVDQKFKVNFRIVMKHDEIIFYMLVPAEKKKEIVRKIEGTYDSNVTLNEVDFLPSQDPKKSFCTELRYRKHDIFSLSTDRSNNYPLPSLLAAVRTLEEGDLAVFDALLQPASKNSWKKTADDAYDLLDRGYVPGQGMKHKVLRLVDEFFRTLRDEIIQLTRLTPKQKQEFREWKKKQDEYKHAKRILEDMSNATKRKRDGEVLDAYLRASVESDNEERARSAAYNLTNAWSDISEDNALTPQDVPKKLNKWYIEGIEERKGRSIRFSPLKVSTEEAGKMLQIPGRELIEEYPVKATKHKQVEVPAELTKDVKGVPLGYVKYRGEEKLVKIPLESYDGVSRDDVYDALCTASFAQGKQGSGKSEGYGTNWAYNMVMAGYTVILIDTADGEVLDNFLKCLPKKFPSSRIYALDFDNKAHPIPLNWNDIYGRDFGEDEELKALEISERITSRFIKFINSITDTDKLTDRMARYVKSCMRAITTKKDWTFLDLELALSSPSYREELLQLEKVQDMPAVKSDLETLQKKEKKGNAGYIVDPIIDRIKKLSSNTFLQNLFYQKPNLDENGDPVLDFRKLMDNKNGKYGNVITIKCTGDAWQDDQATILGFLLDKINFNAFSRVNIPQKDRKPALIWIDEPHKVINRLEGKLAGTAVEFRKYRIKNLFTGHSIAQMGKAADALLDGGAQVTSYKTERLSQLKKFSHKFKPYEDPKELYDALPEKWTAVNSVRLPSGRNCPAFIARMKAPPEEKVDRSKIWEKCSEKYGRYWARVRDRIRDKRNKYQELDQEWRE